MHLIIVESPTKGKTIEKFLGKNYLVRSSYGHIRDLPKGELGVDVEKDFKPKYVIPPKARPHIAELKKELPKAELVILATDADREGESIAYHLAQIFELNGKKPYQRIVFHEITKTAIGESLKNPRKLDLNLVNAQQTRRILDRLVGYKLSPFLWRKVVRGLSAGRVQSVAVRFVVEREREIEKFKPEEYWSIEALLDKIRNPKSETRNKSQIPNPNPQTQFKALLTKKDNETIPKLGIKNKKDAEKIVKDLKGAEYKVKKIEKKENKKNPLPPFTTSTLQQEGWQKFRWPARMTMGVAQNLYEKGLCTYHRTDSLNLSQMSQDMAKKFIIENFGKEYWPGFSRTYKTKSKTAQEAHEAIRPSYPDKTPELLKVKAKLDERQFRLYDLIWRRFMACQMETARFDSTVVEVEARNSKSKIPNHKPRRSRFATLRGRQIQNSKFKIQNYTLRASGQIMKFDGFLKVYPLKFEENELPPLQENEELKLKELIPSQHFTQPPPRYTEASLIKVLEKEGIGRPSTYAPILETIQQRNYVAKNEKKQLVPKEIGFLVNDLLVLHFPRIVDIKFTAGLEENLDKIAQGKKEWVKTLKDFYEPFEENLKKKYNEVSKQALIEETNRKCPNCDSPLIIRWGKFGKFYACSSFPKCKYTEPLRKPGLGIKCPNCQKGEIIEKHTKKGKTFYGCNKFPDCDFALWDKPLVKMKENKAVPETCSQCGSFLVEKGKKIICSNKDCVLKKSFTKFQS